VLRDGDAQTACAQACSANAIVFGNVHDSQSQVNAVRKANPQRSFYVLEQLHVLPNITYLSKVRNTDEIIVKGEHHEGDEKMEGSIPAKSEAEHH
jgi:molybdopterin-containing oxidoreductase family iron-sulfur binding subunit